MPLDLSGFNSGEDQFQGLYKIGSDLQKNREMDLKQQQDNQDNQNQQLIRKTAAANYFKTYLNPKNFHTGTINDPVITNGIHDALGTAMQLINQGVDVPTVSTIINSQVGQISQASQNVQALNLQKQTALKALSKVPGVDPEKFDQSFNNSAYYNTDANGKPVLKGIGDLASMDYSKDYVDDVLKNGDVYNSGGIDDFMKTATPTTVTTSSKIRNSAGRLTQVSGQTVAPSFMVPETDKDGVIKQQFVPKNTTATDGDTPLFNEALGKGKTDQPIQMVTDEVWDQLGKSHPSSQAFIRQEVRTDLKNHPDIRLDSPQAENLAKAYAFQYMKNSQYNGGHFKRGNVNMLPWPVKQSASTIANNTPPQTIDYFNGDNHTLGLKQIVDNSINQVQALNPRATPYTRFNSAPPQVQDILLKQAQVLSGDKGLTNSDLYFYKGKDGNIQLMEAAKHDRNGNSLPVPQTDKSVMTVDPLSLNIPANQAVTKVGTGKTKPQTMNSVINTSKPQQEKKSSGIKWK